MEWMPQSLHALHAHIIFSTKLRHPYLEADVRPRAHAYLATLLTNLECQAVTVGGIEDHVHILCNLSKKAAPIKVIEEVKKESSKFVKTLKPVLRDFSWQPGYGLFSVGAKDLATVQSYIRRQEEHHKGESFEEEFRRLLLEAEIPFDERYFL